MARNDYEEDDNAKAKRAIKYVLIAFFGILFLILIFDCWYTVDAGDRGLVLTFGKLSDNVAQPGIHFKIPIIQSVVIMSVRTQTITFDNKQATGTDSEYSSLAAFSQDLQDVAIATIVNYHLNDGDVRDIYTKYGNMQNYQQNILEPIIRDVVKTEAAAYTAEELNSKRLDFEQKITDALTARFAEKSAVFDKLSITNFEYTTEFSAAINRKVIAQQDALAAQNKLAQVQYEAQQQIAAAEGSARAIQIQTDSLNRVGGQNYLTMLAIQKWGGNLPVVMGGNAMPFINLNTLTPTSTAGSSITNLTG